MDERTEQGTATERQSREMPGRPGIFGDFGGSLTLRPEWHEDTLKLEYPNLATKIDEAYRDGWSREELRGYLAEQERERLKWYSADEVNEYLGRTPETQQRLWDAAGLRHEDLYVEAMKDKMPAERVRTILETARKTDLPPGLLLQTPWLANEAERAATVRKAEDALKEFEGTAGAEKVRNFLARPGELERNLDNIRELGLIAQALERYSESLRPGHWQRRPQTLGEWWDQGRLWDAFQQGWAHTLFGRRADRLEREAQILEGRPDEIETEAGLRISNPAMNYLPDEELRMAVRSPEVLRERAAGLREWEKWLSPAPFERPDPWSARGLLYSVAENAPYTLTGLPINMISSALFGWQGALASGVYSAHDEARDEQTGVFKALMAQGMSAEEAEDQSFWKVYVPDFLFLSTSNFIQNMLTFGGPLVPAGPGAKEWIKAATRGVFLGKPELEAGAGALKRFWNFTLGAGAEGFEEGFEKVMSNRGEGKENDWGEIAYEAVVGTVNGLVFSGVGTVGRAALGRVTAWRDGVRSARRAEAAGAALDEVVKAAAASRVLERTPEAMKDFLKSVAPDGKGRVVTMDANTFMQVMGPEADAAAEALGIQSGLEEALSTGGDVEIETAALAGRPEIYEKVKDDIRLEEDGMSRNEAKAYQEEEPERRRKLAEEMETAARELKEAGEEAARVREDFRQQLEALGHQVVGKRDAEELSLILTRGVMDFARERGISVAEAARRPEWNIRFVFDKEGRPTAEDAYRQIIGEKGAAALDEVDRQGRIDNLGVAREMEKAGKDKRTIRLATGWERGTDGKWRYEIMDDFIDVAKLGQLGENYKNYNFRSKKKQPAFHASLEMFIKDKALLNALKEAYGELPEVYVDDGEGFGGGKYNPDSNSIHLSLSANPSVLLHEVQHFIQRKEGFETGTNTEMTGAFIRSNPEFAEKLERAKELEKEAKGKTGEPLRLAREFRKLEKSLGFQDSSKPMTKEEEAKYREHILEVQKENPDAIERLKEIRRKKSEAMAEAKRQAAKLRESIPTADDVYRKSAGETEARNASARMDMSAEERRRTLLEETEDVRREDQIVLRGALGDEGEAEPEKYSQEHKPASVEENISNGKAAINKVITEQTDAIDAMYRDKIGAITFLWGNKGGGIAHILKNHIPDGMAPQEFLNTLVDVIATGEVGDEYSIQNGRKRRVNIVKEPYTVVLGKEYDGQKMNWVVTGWDERVPDKRKSRFGVPNKGQGFSDTTLSETTPSVTEREQSDSSKDNLQQPAPGVNTETYTQQGKQGLRGYVNFRDAETVVTILKTANRSTLLHEMGHVFLNSRRALAMMEGASEQVRQDWETLAKWLGIEGIDLDQPLSEEDARRWRNAHEKFAAGFEKYLMEGKAPTTALAKAFRTFRRWLTDIYRAVKNVVYIDADGNAQTFEISDEAREVMDRMLASEEEIEGSRAVRDAEELARILKEQGIPDDVAARYQDQIQKAEDAAKARLMRLLISELGKEKRQELKAARKEARKRVAAEVWEQPEYKALKALRRPLDKGGVRLSMMDLVDLYGDAEARKLISELPFGVVANDGLTLEDAASLLGYPAGEALLEDLRKAGALSPAKAISDRVKAETAELESLANNREALRAEAEKALHGKERAEWLAMEAELMRKAVGKVKEQITKDARQEQTRQEREAEREAKAYTEEMFSPESLAAWTEAAEETARKIVAGKRMMDLSPARYLASERRAGEKALKAAATGRLEEALQWKRTEIINHALAAEALRVREDYQKGRKYLEKFWPNRKRLRGAMGNAAFDQIIGLLARVGVNQEDERAKDRPRLGEYLRGLADAASPTGETTLAAPRWITDLDVTNRRMRLAEMTLGQFQDVRDLVKRIEHVGRLEKSLIASGEAESFEAVLRRLEEATEAEFGKPGGRNVNPNDRGAGLLGQFLASLDRVETLLKKADGLKEQGVWWETFYRPAQRAYEAEVTRAAEAREAIRALYRKHFPDRKAFAKFLNTKMDTGLWNPKDGKKIYWTGENLLSAMLNWGNEHNRERLVFGNGFVENALRMKGVRAADDAQYLMMYQEGKALAEQVFRNLGNEAMWDFCQDVWDLIDGYWPEIKALEEKMTGVAPEKVEATPVRTAGGRTLRGGYYPVKFDARLDWKALVHGEKETVRALYEDQGHRAATRHGHTKERVERVAPRMLSLSLGVIDEHLGNVIHDLTHRPVVRDLNKLVKNDKVRELLIHAVGQEGFKQFNPWVEALAAPSTPTDPVGRVFSKMMGTAAAVGLGLNPLSMVGQTVSLVPAMWKLGPVRVLPAVANTLTLRGLWGTKFREEAFALSTELRDRVNGSDRDLRAALELERSGAGRKAISGAKAALYLGIGWMDMVVSVPVWHAAYDKGMSMFNGDQQRAVDYADSIIRQTNNTGAVKDLAAVQRGPAIKKAFTMYYSAFGSMYQMFSEEMTRAGRTGLPGKVRLAAFCFMMFAVQAALEDALKGRAPWNDDDDDRDEVSLWMLRGALGSFSSMFPLWRDVAGGVKALGGYGDYRGSPVFDAGTNFVRAINSVSGAIGDLWDGEDPEGEKVVKDLFRAGGYAFGLPTVQLLRWYKTFVRWAEGAPDFSPMEFIWAKRSAR